jgi:hypothetical protein
MVIFILAATAAFLLCGPFAPGRLSKWLKRRAHALLLNLFLFLLAAVLIILVAATANPSDVGLVLLALPMLSLFFAMGSLVYRLPASVQSTAKTRFARALTAIKDWRQKKSGALAEPTSVQPVAVQSTSEPTSVPPASVQPTPPRPTQPAAAGWPHRYRLFVLLGLVVVGLAALLAIPFGSSWFRPVAIVLAIYAWLIVAGFRAFLARSSHSAFKWLRRHKWQTRLILRSLLFTAVLSTFVGWNGDAWAYTILLAIHRITSMPETIHALLGAVAGLMCGNFSRWMDYTRSRGVGKAETSSQSQLDDGLPFASPKTSQTKSSSANSESVRKGGGRGRTQRNEQKPKQAHETTRNAPSEMWPMIVFAAALSCILVAALVGPYERSALSRVSGLETPYLKVQFAIPPSLADKQQILNVERDLNNLGTLEEFTRSLRFIQYDCAQAALDAALDSHGIDDFVNKQSEKSLVFRAGIAFRHNLIPYISRIVKAKRQGYNPFVLKARVRQVADKFALLTNDGDFERSYHAAMSEVQRQHQLFRDEGVADDQLPEEVERLNIDPDPSYCWPSKQDIDLVSRNVRLVAQKMPRLILGFPASLFFFEGNVDAANMMIDSAFRLDEKTEDINLISSQADALYVGARDLREVLQTEERELEIIEKRIGQVGRAKSWKEDEIKADPTRETENKIRDDLARRYSRGRFILRPRLAYLWAQHGLGSDEDLLPQRDLHWSSAQKYADDAYESLLDKSKSPPHFACTDQAVNLRIKDTYAFVKLAYQAYNVKTQRRPPDEFEVRRAREVLEDAMAEARDAHRRLEDAMTKARERQAVDATAFCFTEVETRAWVRRVASHLKLAEALQP